MLNVQQLKTTGTNKPTVTVLVLTWVQTLSS